MANFVSLVNAGRFNDLVMYCGVYAPWDHYPKFLRQSEVGDSMKVLTDFFDISDIERYLERLKRWQHHAANCAYSEDKDFMPCDLLFYYELNVRLLESLFILLLKDQNQAFVSDHISEEQLAEEKRNWNWYPDNLERDELLNPYLVIECAFKEINPAQFRDYLWKWLKAALSEDTINELVLPGGVIKVYDHLVKLYSAAWIIFQRANDKHL
ncbi:hypothetical protein [Mucilaginibacter sp. FT3.2]|uniref:hypothetical protein n=1 Tax=Mucilaginibacter sp. FT3.2 TaxID=2723090 RepID=UPI0016097832|nr:hypothetical protein [Mucilaginibacter sp. FT3.2]MBB6233816.1 hypothetical protein [Mucilaginibacter sp. FT3.2]